MDLPPLNLIITKVGVFDLMDEVQNVFDFLNVYFQLK